MPWIGPAISVGGGLLSGAFGGARDPGPSNVLQNSRTDALGQSARFNDEFWGSNWRGGSGPASAGASDWINGGNPTNFSNFRYGDGTNGRPGTTAAGNGPGGGGGQAGGAGGSPLYGGTTPFGNAPILQQMYSAANTGIGNDQNALQNYGGAITRLGESGYRQAQKYGTGQAAVINSGADLALKNANAQTLARLTASGLGGSTVATDSMGANAAGIERGRQANLANVADQATGMRIGQRNTQAAQQQALSGMYNTFAERDNNLRMMPINGQLQALGSPTANPFSVQGGSAPTNASNGGIQNVGNALGQYGGMLTAQQLYPNLFQQGGTGAGSNGLAGFNQYFGSGGANNAGMGGSPFGN